MDAKIVFIGRLLLILLFFYFSFQLLFTSQHWIFLDYANLLVHEGGHVIFSPFGEFIHVLGGSITQIAIPCAFFAYFLRRKEYFSTSTMLFWIADNFVNVSIYMKDAKLMQLPLLGGSSIHDWNWLFSQMGLLTQNDIISTIFFSVGVFFLILSLIGVVFFAILDFLKSLT